MNKKKRLPDFFLIGAPKAGTTSLFHYIIQHPDIFPCKFKETRFFMDDFLFDKGVDFYLEKYFYGAESYKKFGEGTPAYLGHPETVIPRMKSSLGDHIPKFLIILRDPVDRAWSNYQHRKRNMVEKLDFWDAIADEPQRRANNSGIFLRYFEGGLYGQQIQKWQAAYPKSQFKVFFYEQLKKPQLLLKEIFEFLDLEGQIEIDFNRKKNTASKPKSKLLYYLMSNMPSFFGASFRKIVPLHLQKEVRTRLRQSLMRPIKKNESPKFAEADRKKLREMYISDIELLEDILAIDLKHWKES